MLTWRELRGLILIIVSFRAHTAPPRKIKAVIRALSSRDPDAMTNASEGLLEQTVMIGRVPLNQLFAMGDKRWWYNLSMLENIPNPPILRECVSGRVKEYATISPSTFYIVKVHNEFGGKGVDMRKGNDLPPCTKDYVVQRRLVDCNVDVTRHFRVTTLFDGTIFAVHDMRARKLTDIISNGGTQKLCNRQCANMSVVSTNALHTLVNKLAEVHGRQMSNILSCGWDVMLDCDTLSGRMNAYVLEGNVLHSALFPGDGLAAEYRRHVDRYLHKVSSA